MEKVKLIFSRVAVLAAIGTAFTTQASKGALATYYNVATNADYTCGTSCKKVGLCDYDAGITTCFAIPATGILPARITLFTISSTPTCCSVARGIYTRSF